MFKKILLFLIIFIPYLFAQRTVDGGMLWWASSKGYVNSWTPANLPIDTTDNYVYFYGEAPKTKVAKDSGGVSVRPYMRVWSDSIERVINGTFDSDSTEWDLLNFGSLEWVASGGGFTGALHFTDIVGTGGVAGIKTDSLIITNGIRYNISFDINVISLSSSIEYGLGSGGGGVITSTGITNIDTVISTTSAENFYLNYFYVIIYPSSTGEFYIDNVSIMPVIDSTYGYTHIISRPSDTTTYYYSQSVKWVQKDKDTIWLAAETDTVTVYPYIEPQPDNINYMRTVDGDTMFTAEGDTMKTSYNFNFNKTNGEKNEEDIILPQRVYAVLNERRSTMDIETS